MSNQTKKVLSLVLKIDRGLVIRTVRGCEFQTDVAGKHSGRGVPVNGCSSWF